MISPSSWMESALGCRAGKGYSWGVMSDWCDLGPGSLLVTLEELLRDLRNWFRLFKLIGGWFVNPNLYTYSGTSVHLRTHSSYLSWLQTYPVSGAWWCWSWESANHAPAGSLTARLCQDGPATLQDGEGRAPSSHLLPVCLRPLGTSLQCSFAPAAAAEATYSFSNTLRSSLVRSPTEISASVEQCLFLSVSTP